jgi:2-hydroxy-6-oxonona-2,4-dienedioate hydrolase
MIFNMPIVGVNPTRPTNIKNFNDTISLSNHTDEEFIKRCGPIRRIPSYAKKEILLQSNSNHIYYEIGFGKPVIFCPGLFGGIYNILEVFEYFSEKYRMLMPFFPMYDMPLHKTDIKSLGNYLGEFINDLNLKDVAIIGSSMGGGIAMIHTILDPTRIKAIILCGSSGISNIPLTFGFFKRKNYENIKMQTQNIFHNKNIPPDEMIEEVYNLILSYENVIRAIRLTKSVRKYKMHEDIKKIKTPTLLIWGKNDPITPPEIGVVFNQLISNSELHCLDNCGHVPTQEKPTEVIVLIQKFFGEIQY